PITQNKRHVELLKEILIDYKIIKVCPVHSLIVIANDKTVISKKFAKTDIKKQIIKHDQLSNKLVEFQAEQAVKLSDKRMYNIAEAILNLHKPITIDYLAKFGIKLHDEIKEVMVKKTDEIITEDKETEEVS